MGGPSYRTVHRHLQRLELLTRPDGQPPDAFGRFEATRPNELWVGDALHGPKIAGHKAYLFAFVDDHSRAVVGHRWGGAEDSVRLAAALRPALAARGVPGGGYVDNGSAFVDSALLRACARLGIKLIHSTPGRPPGRGKVERFFRTVQKQFLVEVDTEKAKTATVSLQSNTYNVDASLVGRQVELVFDPFDLTDIDVRFGGRSFGKAIPHQITRHAHPKAKPETPAAAPPAPTGIDYLRLIDTEGTKELGRRINYEVFLPGQDQPTPAVDLSEESS
ncbi:DDE-type integrase/transposase/recombinase [Streptomyces sp. NPDC046942]|uniref:DDE-type integrase/transposase/recombinase n=1 Tax=Streptomyces sp. NPDC046942 TaxID=3155137 RepID=UPI00340E16FE